VTNRQFRNYWGPVILFALFIFALSSMPRPPILSDWDFSDKYKHVMLFGVFAATLWRALTQTLGNKPAWLVIYTVAISSLYGASDEFHQLFTPGRSCDWRDWMADTIGAILVCVALIWLRSRHRAEA